MMLTAKEPPMATAAAVPCPAEANEIATAPAPAVIWESFLAWTVTPLALSIGAVVHLGGHVGIDAVDRAGTSARGGDPAAGLLRDGRCEGTGHGVGLDPGARDGLDQEGPGRAGGHHAPVGFVTDSTSASTSATIVLTAIATPAEIAVALPWPPLAIASDRPPAMAKMSEVSVGPDPHVARRAVAGREVGSCCRPCGRWCWP